MVTVQKGIVRGNMGDGQRWSNNNVTMTMERNKGSEKVTIKFPAGPRTEKKIEAEFDEKELHDIILWMRGETR